MNVDHTSVWLVTKEEEKQVVDLYRILPGGTKDKMTMEKVDVSTLPLDFRLNPERYIRLNSLVVVPRPLSNEDQEKKDEEFVKKGGILLKLDLS